jgi:hypothetical protein
LPRRGRCWTFEAFRRRDHARETGAYRTKKLPRTVDAQPVIHGMLKVAFDDEGVVDLHPLIAKGRCFPG